jgi:hypothetical protein
VSAFCVCAHADTNYYVTLGVVSHVLKCLTMVGEGVGLMKIRHAMTSNEGGGGFMKVRHAMTSNEGRGLFLPEGIREPIRYISQLSTPWKVLCKSL